MSPSLSWTRCIPRTIRMKTTPAPWPLWLCNVRRARQSSALVILACHGVGFAERAATTTIHDTTDHIELTPSERLSLGNLNLELGTVTEQVLVSSAATPVQTASAERFTSLTANQVTNLTMYGRTVTSLVALSPGVVDTIGANNRALGGGGGNGINFNIAGSRSTNNGFTIDGITLNAVGGAPNASYGISMRTSGGDGGGGRLVKGTTGGWSVIY